MELIHEPNTAIAITFNTFNETNINPFVAVEFDVLHNPWDDIGGPHVGIDINSLRSSNSSVWDPYLNGRTMGAGISYDFISKNLCVSHTKFSENIDYRQELCYEVDLRDYLPEWATVGFSAATGSSSEFHAIHSWSFNATLRTLQQATRSTTMRRLL
ncbi:alpha-methyl-mannoside-specific lectin-like [Mercurialis annua]|uniref:alpha-methyl-mannoside-specific lectin-like n=1 Tax=Mercurialis annua TaxID=3986 RepID=UPI002160E4E4|nr:alpha-methyl-mannoside-specific lectin-like [Mercurialis annua]